MAGLFLEYLPIISLYRYSKRKITLTRQLNDSDMAAKISNISKKYSMD